MLGAEKTGWYAAAVRLTVIQSTLLQGFAALALPLANDAVRRGDERRYASRVFLFGGALAVGVTAMLAVATPLAVQLVFGDRFAPSVPVYQVYALGLAINFVGGPLSQLLYAHGRPERLTLIHLLQLGALLAGLPYAARRHDLLGVVSWWSIVNWVCVLVIIHLSLAGARRGPGDRAVTP
jgi:O-antigen/teichoic acid export membrane protein